MLGRQERTTQERTTQERTTEVDYKSWWIRVSYLFKAYWQNRSNGVSHISVKGKLDSLPAESQVPERWHDWFTAEKEAINSNDNFGAIFLTSMPVQEEASSYGYSPQEIFQEVARKNKPPVGLVVAAVEEWELDSTKWPKKDEQGYRGTPASEDDWKNASGMQELKRTVCQAPDHTVDFYNKEDVKSTVMEMRMAILSGKSVVVHCFQGKGRSATIVALYKMVFEKKSYWEVVKEIKKERTVVSLNNSEKQKFCEDVAKEMRTALGLPSVVVSIPKYYDVCGKRSTTACMYAHLLVRNPVRETAVVKRRASDLSSSDESVEPVSPQPMMPSVTTHQKLGMWSQFWSQVTEILGLNKRSVATISPEMPNQP